MNVNEITFGIELETTIPAGAIPVGAYHVGVQAAGLPVGWKAMRDGSIAATAGREGCEFVSPVLCGEAGLQSVLDAIAAIRAMGGKVNSSCGCHVHVKFPMEAGALTRLVALVGNFEKAIFASTGTKNRENGRYCKPLSRSALNAAGAAAAAGNDRYHVLNLTNLARGVRPTVEFRAFSGTLDPVKAIAYIRLCVAMVERALEMTRQTNWKAKTPVETSPVARSGEGQTDLARLMLQLGWTKGRASKVYGAIGNPEATPSIKDCKAELTRLAKKYDGGSEESE